MTRTGKSNQEELYLLIAYDIANNKRRDRIAKFLTSLFIRRQYSLFEGWIPAHLLERTHKRLNELIDPKEDTIRIFQLTAKTRKDVILLGRNLPLIPQHRGIIL